MLRGPMLAAAANMIARFKNIEHKHRGESGRGREEVVREFLGTFLPGRLAVAAGEIVTSAGGMSPAMDVIIYDRLDTPLFDNTDGRVIVPVEGVYAVVEVASQLTVPKLKEDAEKIRAVKQLKKNPAAYRIPETSVIEPVYHVHGRESSMFPILGYVFAYEGTGLDTLYPELVHLDESAPVHERVDLILSLAHGCIANTNPERGPGTVRGFPSPGSERVRIHLDSNRGSADTDDGPGEALMLFYVLMSGVLGEGRTLPINLAPYIP